jgi:hypothetical protein
MTDHPGRCGVVTNEEIIVIVDLALQAENGEVTQDELDAALGRLVAAEERMAFDLAYKILSGRPYGVLSDNPIMLFRAISMGEYVNASMGYKQFEIGKDEWVDMTVFYPRQHHVRPGAARLTVVQN